MRYYSTLDRDHTVTLQQAVLRSQTADNGLYLPERVPQLPRAFIANLGNLTLQEMSYAVANYALQGDIPAHVLHDIVEEALNFPMPLTHMSGDRYALEMFHGPTLGYKDVSARFMARMVAHFAQAHRRPIDVLITTHGNSGGAVAAGFHNIPGVHLWVLYPQDTLTPIQEAQFATLGGNVTAIEVQGTIDECKHLALQAFADHELNDRMQLTTAKSINIARLLPQMFYYFWAWAQLAQRGQAGDNVVFSVPCGNLGNLTAGVMARMMGLPIKRFIAADNCNNVFSTYLDTGKWQPQQAMASTTPSLDIGNPRNIGRLLSLLGSHQAMTQIMQGISLTDEEILAAIAHTWNNERYLLDPHGAVSYQALRLGLDDGEVGVALAEAHPAKYKATVEAALGHSIPIPTRMQRFLTGTRHVTSIPGTLDALKQVLLKQ